MLYITSMGKRVSVTFTEKEYCAVHRLAQREHRSDSECIAAIVARAIPELRQEWGSQQTITSLPPRKRAPKDREIEEMPLHPER